MGSLTTGFNSLALREAAFPKAFPHEEGAAGAWIYIGARGRLVTLKESADSFNGSSTAQLLGLDP